MKWGMEAPIPPNSVAALLDQPGDTLRILVVEDEAFNRMAIKAMLEASGHRVIEAANGREAVEHFRQEPVDLVLMDIYMPEMDGYEATRQIKTLSHSRFVPIIFLTASSEEDILSRCIESGGDDFLTKPVTLTILNAKIKAQARIQKLHHTVIHQNEELNRHRLDEARDQEIAGRIFNRIVHLGCLDESNIPYLTSPVALFNGDILLAARTPNNTLRVMLGDFTGHGLPAAVGAIPTAEIFYKMTNQGHHLSEVIARINDRLHEVLLTGYFCAASFVEIDFHEGLLMTWTGGLPDILLYGDEPRRIKQHIKSDHVPLGILPTESINTNIIVSKIDPQDQLLLYTDGITDAANDQGELFGEARIETCITQSPSDSWAMPRLLKTLKQFQTDSQQQDDITLVELPLTLNMASSQAKSAPKADHKPSSHWLTRIRFDGIALQNTSALPLLMRNIQELQNLDEHRSSLYTILSELFNNSLEHGLLELDSALKKSAEGFLTYYEQREQRLAALSTTDFIDVEFEHEPLTDGGRLHIRISDSSRGFDASQLPDMKLEDITGHCGRGLPLVRSLCESLKFADNGRVVEASFRWH